MFFSWMKRPSKCRQNQVTKPEHAHAGLQKPTAHLKLIKGMRCASKTGSITFETGIACTLKNQ